MEAGGSFIKASQLQQHLGWPVTSFCNYIASFCVERGESIFLQLYNSIADRSAFFDFPCAMDQWDGIWGVAHGSIGYHASPI